MSSTHCPTCGSGDPNTYYGSCFDNRHDSIFDPRFPMDPWHDGERERRQAEKRAEINRLVAGDPKEEAPTVHEHRHSPAAVRDRLILGESYSSDSGEES